MQKINFVIAFIHEAKPIIQFFKLTKFQSKPYAIYKSEQISLIISGCGKLNSAAACGFLFALDNQPAQWINFGIAGHRDASIGQAFIGNKVTDSDCGWHWTLSTQASILLSLSINTVAEPETQFNDECLYEMEASGFMTACIKYTSLENISVIKIISDNQQTSHQTLTAKKIKQLVSDQLGNLEQYINTL